MATPSTTVTSKPRRVKLLLVTLAALAVVYVALLPTLLRMSREAARIERQTAQTKEMADSVARFRAGMEAAATAVERSPNDPGAHLELATRLTQAGRIEEAMNHAAVADRLKPNNPRILEVKADLEQRAHRYDEAIRSYKSLLAVEPSNAHGFAGLR